MASIVPVAKSLYLCEEVDVEGGMTNLYGFFNAIHPDSYPHVQESFICFAQLLGGLGEVSMHIDVRDAETKRLIDCSETHRLFFPDRTTLLQIAAAIAKCPFERPGVVLVELYCENTWVADTTVRLQEIIS